MGKKLVMKRRKLAIKEPVELQLAARPWTLVSNVKMLSNRLKIFSESNSPAMNGTWT